MTLDLSEVVNDNDLAEAFIIVRSVNGTFGAGGWSNQTRNIQAWGVVTPATAKEMKMIPEADQVDEAFMFYAACPIYTTRALEGENSDILQWHEEQFRVIKVWDYDQRGFYSAMAVRTVGA